MLIFPVIFSKCQEQEQMLYATVLLANIIIIKPVIKQIEKLSILKSSIQELTTPEFFMVREEWCMLFMDMLYNMLGTMSHEIRNQLYSADISMKLAQLCSGFITSMINDKIKEVLYICLIKISFGYDNEPVDVK